MTRARPERPRVAVATPPRLLADALRSLLDDTLEVTVVIDGTDEDFDLAIVTRGGPRVTATEVIVLEGSPHPRGSGVLHREAAAHLYLPDLDAVVAVARNVGKAGPVGVV